MLVWQGKETALLLTYFLGERDTRLSGTPLIEFRRV
jgi:hypothetical protein